MIVRIDNDIKAALKAKDSNRLKILRSLKAAIKYQAIELKRDLTEDEILAVLQGQVKSREQAAEMYIQGNRPDLAEIEQAEIEIIKAYLPEPLTLEQLESEVDSVIAELNADSMKDMGSVMSTLKEKLGSRADGKILSGMVRSKLSK